MEQNTNTIFVYGTLMEGQRNHSYFLSNASYLGEGSIKGYRIYDLGSFPGIVPGQGTVYGEVYQVSNEELKDIDRLEGEGSLYIKTKVQVLMDEKTVLDAWVYVYNHSISGCQEVHGKYGLEEVWYVSYGSNMLEERLKYYIQGGYCKYNQQSYGGCKDKTMPKESRAVIIPYDMIYGNYARGSWKNSAVSFLDVSKPGKSYGRAYKIRKNQLEDIHRMEGKGREWYPECMELEEIDGRKAYTFVNYSKKEREPFSRVSAEYGYVLFEGMKETYPTWSHEEIYEYLRDCGRNRSEV